MQSLVLEFYYKQFPVYVSIDNCDILKLLIQQNSPQECIFNKYDYIGYVCTYILSLDENIMFKNYYDNTLLENFGVTDAFAFSIGQYLIGKIGTNNPEIAPYIKYTLKLDNAIQLPIVSGIDYTNEIIIGQELVSFSCGTNLYRPQLRASYCKFDINYNSQKYVIYSNLTELRMLLTKLDINYDDSGNIMTILQPCIEELNDYFLHQITVEKITLSTKIKYQSYLPITIIIGEFKMTALLDKWHNIISQPKDKCGKNNIADVIIPTPLIHGVARISLEEIINLELGDIILFDESYAPKNTICDFGAYTTNFELIDDITLKFTGFNTISTF